MHLRELLSCFSLLKLGRVHYLIIKLFHLLDYRLQGAAPLANGCADNENIIALWDGAVFNEERKQFQVIWLALNLSHTSEILAHSCNYINHIMTR